MPLSADRRQVTWGPIPLKRVEVGRGGSRVYVCLYSERAQSMCMWVSACVVCVCLAVFSLRWSDILREHLVLITFGDVQGIKLATSLNYFSLFKILVDF